MKSESQMQLFEFEQTNSRKQRRPRSIALITHEISRRIVTLRRMQSRLVARAVPIQELFSSVAHRPWTEIAELVAKVYWNAEGIISTEEMAGALGITPHELNVKMPALKMTRQCKSCLRRCLVTLSASVR